MTCTWRPHKRNSNGRLDPWRRMIAADLGLDLLKSPWDPVLLAAGIEALRLDPMKLRAKNHGWWAGQMTSRTPKTEAQVAAYRQRNTVEGAIVRQEVRDILRRYRRLGEVLLR